MARDPHNLPPYPRPPGVQPDWTMIESTIRTMANQLKELHTEVPRLVGTVIRLENQQREHERRIIRVEGELLNARRAVSDRPRSERPNRFNPTDTGHHYVVETDRGQFVKVPTKRLESLAELYAASWLVRVMRQYGTHLAVGGLGVLGTFLWHWFSAAR